MSDLPLETGVAGLVHCRAVVSPDVLDGPELKSWDSIAKKLKGGKINLP